MKSSHISASIAPIVVQYLPFTHEALLALSCSTTLVRYLPGSRSLHAASHAVFQVFGYFPSRAKVQYVYSSHPASLMLYTCPARGGRCQLYSLVIQSNQQSISTCLQHTTYSRSRCHCPCWVNTCLTCIPSTQQLPPLSSLIHRHP